MGCLRTHDAFGISDYTLLRLFFNYTKMNDEMLCIKYLNIFSLNRETKDKLQNVAFPTTYQFKYTNIFF